MCDTLFLSLEEERKRARIVMVYSYLTLNKEARKAIDNAIDRATCVGAAIEIEVETNEGHKLRLKLK